MGGKHKQAQRTKNNARPSSSGRSAELLANTLPQFAGLSSMKDAGFTLPNFSLTPMDDTDSSVDSNFQLVLKKMNKKDSTTKLKALQEFTDLVKAADQEAVKTILPVWTRLYNVLATDAEHKVREATHLAHHQVVIKAKRNLAPYLKQLSGPWFTSQYDTYAPAASSATKSFEDAFPPSKLQEAIVFCQDEILKYICDNLTVHTAQSLSNPKTTAEDAEAKYERVVISSLQGYALYLNKVSADSTEKAKDLSLKIIGSARFWKLSRNKLAPIRAAWFSVLTSLCHKAPFLLQHEIGRVTNSIFSNLDESEPTVLPSLWEAALLTVTVLDDWWTHVNIEKVLLPKLFKILREGGQGNATVVFPNLLPFLSHMPQDVIDLKAFYFNFFDSMRAGLKQKSVLSSRSESAMLSVTLIECMQYIILKNQADVVFCEKLIKAELIPVIEWCLTGGQGSYKSLFNQIASLIQYWHRNRNHADVSNYACYLVFFWNRVDLLFKQLLINLEHNYEKNATSELAIKQLDFLMSLKHVAKSKKMKVKFEAEISLECGDADTGSDSRDKFDETYLNNLNTLVCKTCEHYVTFIKERQSKELVEQLVCLLQEFESKEFFLHLSRMLNSSEESDDLINLYNKILSKWLKSSYLCSKSVVDLVFLLFKYLESEEKNAILDTFTQLPNEYFGWCLARALSHPHNGDYVVQKWLCNEKVDEFLVSIVEKELLDECTPDLNLLLKQAFTESNNGDLLISKAVVVKIVDQISTCLLSPADFAVTIDSCASFAAYISAILYSDTAHLTYGSELLLALFTLSCNSLLNMEHVSQDTLWEVDTAWQDAVSILSSELSHEDFRNLTKQFGFVVEQELLENGIRDLCLEKVIGAVVNFIRAVHKKRFLLENDLVEEFLVRSFVPTWRNIVTDICVYGEYINGNLSSPCEPIEVCAECIHDADILKFFVWSHVTASVLLSPIKEEDEADEEVDKFVMLISTSNINKFILYVLYDVVLAQTFISHFKMTKYCSKIAEKMQLLLDKAKVLFEALHYIEKNSLEVELMEKMRHERWLWSKVVYLLKVEIIKQSPSTCFASWMRCLPFRGDENLGRLHTVQVFAGKLDFDDVERVSDMHENIIVLRSLLHCEELEVQIAECFTRIEQYRSEIGEKFYEIDLGYWKETEISIDIIRLCSALIIHNKTESLSRRQWDFIVVSLASWSNKIEQVKHAYKNVQVMAFIPAVGELFAAVEHHIKTLQDQSPANSRVAEWTEIFAQDVHTNIVKVWLYFAKIFLQEETDVHITCLLLLQNFESAVNHVNFDYIFNNRSNSMPKWADLLETCCTLMTNQVSTLQLWGYHMLMSLCPGLIEIDTLAVNTNTPHVKGLIFKQFKDLLVQTQDIVQTMLIEFKLGEDSCRVEPFTDSFAYTFAYLLCWDVLLNMCEKSCTELRYQYADWLRNQDFLNNLLSNIFKLMPVEVLHYTDGKTKPFHEYFLTKSELSLKELNDGEVIEHMVCWVYAATVSQLPASIRQWWSGTETRIAQVVERVTSAYVSPQLCSQELADVAQHETKFKNMVVKVHPSVREVVAIYTVDEAQMDLVITLPVNYPLGGPDVQCNKQIGGTSHKQWLMQLKMCVLHQNGRIWDGLSLWNNNLDKKFDGVEECYICFAVLHPGTYQLPKLSCQTCRKKFHSACLYKWFSTSNKSTCPICRNLF